MEIMQKSILTFHDRSILLYSILIIILLFVTIMLSPLKIFTRLEEQLIDLRFQIRGEEKPNENLILVVIDEQTKKSLGHEPYPHQDLSTIAHGLQILGAKVVGFDLLFKNYQKPFGDSPSTNVIKNDSNLVYGYYFNSSYQKTEDNLPQYTNQTIRKFALPVQSEGFYRATHVSLPCNQLLENIQYLGYLNITLDLTKHQSQKIPLFIAYKGNVYPAFCVEIIRKYFDISHEEVEFLANKVIFDVPQFLALELPVYKNGEFYINYLGDENVFPHQCSFDKILKESEDIIDTGFHSNASSIFKDKIVLIGNLDGEHFVTPFSDNVPELLLHATLVSNLLNRNFVKSSSDILNLFVLLLLGSMIICMSIKWRIQRSLLGCLGLGMLFNGVAIILFIQSGYILNMASPSVFLILSIVALALVEAIKFTKILANQKETLSKQSLQLKQIDQSSIKQDFSEPYYKIIIPLIKLRDECILTHTLESERDQAKGLVAFETGIQSKHPHLFNINKLNKLSHDIEKLWQIYNLFTTENKQSVLKPIDLLKKIGHRICTEFGLSATFDNIFKLAASGTYLNFVIDDLTIPWHWAYHSERDKVLCDQFPASLSFAIEKANFRNHTSSEETTWDLADQKAVVLLYGNWKGHPTKELHCVDREINMIKKWIEKEKKVDISATKDVDQFLSVLDSHYQNKLNLRIIHYSGHIEGDRMDVGETQYLRAGTIKHSRNLYLYSHPVVFLNGCKSGNLGYLWDKYDDLATEFLACGAAACIITHFDIIESTASKFSIQFYKNFIVHKMTVGEALRQTRIDLSQNIPGNPYEPDYDITRYFYNLYGDPTITF